jgi:hypothetical protein
MQENSLRTASLIAIVAAAGLSSASVAARAADLGGNCCADLEERVAELEATTARKGNRKMSLQVYGQVSENVIWWDDGGESNVYVQENNVTKNRLGFTGRAKITSDWSAGFQLEMQIRAYRSSSANQLALGASNNVTITQYNTQAISLRKANWFIRSNTYGTITVGRTDDASAGTYGVNLASPDGFATNGNLLGRAHQGFFLRRAGTTGTTGLSSFRWSNAFHRTYDDPAQYDYAGNAAVVKYTSPFFLGKSKSSGFQVQTSWGMDDIWAVGLRYAEDFGAIRFAAAVGYSQWGAGPEIGHCSNTSLTGAGNTSTIPGTPGPNGTAAGTSVDCNGVQASASIMHVPTGLYLSGGYGQLTDNNRAVMANKQVAGLAAFIDDTDTSWWVQGGWAAKLNTLGKTTFWGSYAEYTSHFNLSSQTPGTLSGADVLNSFGATAFVQTADASTWGLGVTQDIDAAAMKLYIGYIQSSADFTLIDGALQTRKSNPVDDISVVYTGATLKF